MRHCRLLSCLLLHLNGRAHPLRLDSTWNFGRRARQVHTIESNKIIALGLYPNWHIVRPACPQHPLLVPSSSLAAAVSSRGIAAVSFRRVSTPYWFMVRPVCRQGDLSAAPLVRLLCSDMQIRRLSPPPLLRVALRVAARTLAACPSRRIRRLSPPPVPGIAAVSCRCNAPPYRAAVSLPYHAAAKP